MKRPDYGIIISAVAGRQWKGPTLREQIEIIRLVDYAQALEAEREELLANQREPQPQEQIRLWE